LGQLGCSNDVFTEERYAALEGLLLAEMATTASPEVLSDVCIAFGHLVDPRAAPIALKLIGHPSAKVRLGVVAALSCHEDEAAVAGLIRLSTDDDDDVRDWATFGLGQQIDADTTAIRAALHARLRGRQC
jgi:HEAT repeat protein